MSALGQRVLIQHLCDAESLDTLIREGLLPVAVPDDRLRAVVLYAIDYYHQSGRTKAPSPAVLRSEPAYGQAIEDHDIDIDHEPEESIEWAIDDLKGSWTLVEAQRFNKEFATAMAGSDTQGRVQVLHSAASELVTMSMAMERHDAKVDAREAMAGRLQAYHERAATRGQHRGMHFGLPMIDDYTFGIHDGEAAVLAAPPKTGKAQPLDARLVIPGGSKPMGEIAPGDHVMSPSGLPVRVLAIHPQGDVSVYRVVLDDGSATETCGDHLWEIHPHGQGVAVKTTNQIREGLLSGRKRWAYIPVTKPVEHPAEEHPVDPYLLGALLGDGGMTQASVTLTTADQEMIEMVTPMLPPGVEARQRPRYTWGLVGRQGLRNPLTIALRGLGVMGVRCERKAIPSSYLVGSVAQRWALLQGLLDTDGWIERSRSVCLCTVSPSLAAGVRELVEGLGGTCRVTLKPDRVTSGRSLLLRLRLPQHLGAPFRLSRKAGPWRALAPLLRVAKEPIRQIVEVEYVGVKPAQCITVDSADGLYLTDHHIVTHNSYFLDWVALQEWRARRIVGLYTLENSVDMTLDRIACMACGVDSRMWQRGLCDEDSVQRVTAWLEELAASDVPLWVLQPEMGKRTMEQMVREAQVRDCQSIIIDQLSWVELADPRKAKTERIGDAMHTFKTMISTARRPMAGLLAHQIKRDGVDQARKTGWLEMDFLADSADMERTPDWVFGLYQTMDEKTAQQAKFQTLASRREVNRHFQLTWAVGSGYINVREEITR